MQKNFKDFLSSFCFFPCSSSAMAIQIGDACENIHVHKKEIVGYIKQLTFAAFLFQQITAQGC